MSRRSKSSPSLGKLSRERPSLAEHIILSDPMAHKLLDDRTYAIINAANLEHTIEEIITHKLMPLNAEETIELFVGDRATLSTFSAKIKIARALGLFGRKTRKEIDRIRNIRNVFAHSRKLVSFNTPEVISECAKLTTCSRINRPHFSHYSQEEPWPPIDARQQFYNTVIGIQAALIIALDDEIYGKSPMDNLPNPDVPPLD